MDRTTKLGLVALAGTVIVFMCWWTTSEFWVIGVAMLLYALVRLLNQLGGTRNWKALQSALADYEEIVGGQLWRGNDAEILASDRVDDPRKPGPIEYEHICKTKNGQWFVFRVSVMYGRIIDRSLKPCDESSARLRLQRHRDVYVRCFGQPTVA